MHAQLAIQKALSRVINSGLYAREEVQPASAVYVLHPEQHVFALSRSSCCRAPQRMQVGLLARL